MTDKLTVDTFTSTTFDGHPLELLSAAECPDATIYLPGYFKARVAKTMPTQEAFTLLHNCSVMTYTEIRKKYNF